MSQELIYFDVKYFFLQYFTYYFPNKSRRPHYKEGGGTSSYSEYAIFLEAGTKLVFGSNIVTRHHSTSNLVIIELIN